MDPLDGFHILGGLVVDCTLKDIEWCLGVPGGVEEAPRDRVDTFNVYYGWKTGPLVLPSYMCDFSQR